MHAERRNNRRRAGVLGGARPARERLSPDVARRQRDVAADIEDAGTALADRIRGVRARSNAGSRVPNVPACALGSVRKNAAEAI